MLLNLERLKLFEKNRVNSREKMGLERAKY